MDLQNKIIDFITDCINGQISVFNITKYFSITEIEQMYLMLRKCYNKQSKILGLDLVKPKNKFSVIVPEVTLFYENPDKETYKYKTLIDYFKNIIYNMQGEEGQDLSIYIKNELFGENS
jgi:hypothetical protein